MRLGNLYAPSLFVTVVLVMESRTFVASTVAPETAAPDGSVTLPSMPPVTAVCPFNTPTPNRESTATNNRRRYAGKFIVEPPWTTALSTGNAPPFWRHPGAWSFWALHSRANVDRRGAQALMFEAQVNLCSGQCQGKYCQH